MRKKLTLALISLLALNFTSCSEQDEDNLTVENRELQEESKVVNDLQNRNVNAKHISGYIGRYWHSVGNHFLYTTSTTEAPKGYVFQTYIGKGQYGDVAIGRWYNPSTGDRLLTITDEVKNNPSWVFEGTIGLATITPQNQGSLFGTQPVYRYRKYNGGRHLFTRDFNEVGLGNSYWIYEGIAFHIFINL